MIQPPAKDLFLADMQVSLIDTLSGFHALKTSWDALCQRDPDANVFLSRGWLSHSFQQNPGRWSVLVTTSPDAKGLTGAIPLKYRLHWSKSRNRFQTEIQSGTRLSGAPYAGLLCAPEIETQVIARMAASLATMPWSKLTLANLPHKQRADALADRLKARGCQVTISDAGSASSGKRMSSHVLTLPDRFDTLLSSQVTPTLAQGWEQMASRIGETSDFQVRFVDARDFDVVCDQLEHLAKASGDTRALDRLELARPALRIAAAEQCLLMPVMTRTSEILGGLGHVFDPRDGTLLQLAGVTAPEDKPGDIRAFLTLLAMRWTIENGGLFYDFGRISTRFTKGFATEREETYSLAATRDADSDLCFDPICTSAVLDRIATFVKSRQYDKAIKACAQVSDILRR